MRKKNDAAAANIGKHGDDELLVALAGNPNVGKSTLFNLLTGMNQHTGNWTGKTVSSAEGRFTYSGKTYILCDLPGTYSLNAHSAEEEVARDFLCFSGADAALVVCDASCLERNLNLVLQTLEITGKAVVAVNLMDEAEKKKIKVSCGELSKLLGVPVCPITARSGEGVDALLSALAEVCEKPAPEAQPLVIYPDEIESSVSRIVPLTEKYFGSICDSRFAAVSMLAGDKTMIGRMSETAGIGLGGDDELSAACGAEQKRLAEAGISRSDIEDSIMDVM